MKKPVGRLLYPNTGWYFAAMLLFTAAAAAVGQYILAGGTLFVTLIMFIISRARLSRRKRQLMSYVQTATDSVGISVHAGSAFPMAVIRLPENEIIWGNPSFFTITGLSDTACYQTLDAVVPGFSTSWLREGRSELPGDQIIGGRRYRIYGNYVKSEDDATTVQLATIYFADMTEMFNVRDEFLRTRPIVSIILIDNYDELTANLSDSAISTLDAQLNDVVANWTAGLEALCRKIERNRYLLIFESKDLARLQDGRFSILEDVRHVTTSSGMSATISLGIGKDGGSFAENYRFASLAIEMSLSRGGDQAVIKDRFNFTFYGGRTKEAERHTRVKSRVMAGSLSELIGQSSTVYIMGHRMADLDALGSAVGLLCLCRVKERPARIVINLQKNACQSLIAELKAAPGYEDLFISGLTEWGMYVEVEPTKIEGMVALRDIRSDFFEFDAEHYRLVGRRTHVVYNLGDPVRIRVKNTNLEQKLLDYELVETGGESRDERLDYESGRGTSFISGEDGSFDNVTVGINKAARKEKVRKAIQESKRKSSKSSKSSRSAKTSKSSRSGKTSRTSKPEK